MKNLQNKILVLIMLFCTIGINFNYAQSDLSGVLTGHVGAGNTGYYVGWDANTTFDYACGWCFFAPTTRQDLPLTHFII